MAQKKKKNRKQGHPARQAQNRNTVSIHRAAVDRGIDALTPDYLRWFQDAYGNTDIALAALAVVRTTAGMYGEVTGAVTVTEFDHDDLVEMILAVHEVEQSQQEDGGVDMGLVLLGGWLDYLNFLGDTNRWSGQRVVLEQIIHTLEEAMGHSADAPMMSAEEAEQLALEAATAFNAMPLVSWGRKLLTWIGTGRSVTASGNLQVRDLPEAAACVGENVQVAGPSGRRETDSLFELPQQEEAGSQRVRSMSEIPRLERIYQSLRNAEVIEIGAKEATAGAAAQDFAAEDLMQSFLALYGFVEAYLEEALEPPKMSVGTDFEAWVLLTAWLADALEDEPLAVNAPPAGSLNDESWELALSQMQELVELGLVQADTHFRLPPIVATLIDVIFNEDEEFDDEDFFDQDWPDSGELPTAPGASAPSPAQPTGQVLQLKIGLKGSKPPIWRRVLVPDTMTLDQLHEVIQLSFSWEDSHLHSFEAGGPRGAIYGPGFEPLEDEIDESTVSVGQLLQAEKDKIQYTYDFGDNWEHSIHLEKILEDEGGMLPRCTAGRRMAPVDDCGGIWGWENLVQAVADPQHPEYEEYRRWLGMEGHVQLDPTQFDKDQVNQKLEALN